MPHASVKLLPGATQTETPALNETGVSTTQLVRYVPDRAQGGLIQKYGGWEKYYSSSMVAVTRALWAWEDTISQAHLAIGMENVDGTAQSSLAVLTNGTLADITPRTITDNITAAVASTSGSSILTITDTTTTGITSFDCVFIPVHISIGGVILFGQYPCDPDGFEGSTTYTVQAVDKLGAPLAAASTSSSPTLPLISTTSGSNIVTVTLADHGYVAGDTFPILVPTTVGGSLFYSHYIVQSITSSSQFVIIASQQPTVTTTGYINGNKERFIYGIGFGSLQAGSGYGIGGYGMGGYGTGPATSPATGVPFPADDWALDNWGEILLACPLSDSLVLTTTATGGSGAVGTITFTPTFTIPIGTSIVVSGVVPTNWNGTYTVTASSTGSVSFASIATGAMTTAGTITVLTPKYQPIVQWDSEQNAPIATPIPQAPTVNDGFFVAMPQRQVVAWGTSFTGIQDPLLVRWCDVNNYYSWIGQPTNQAGSYRLPKGSKIVSGMQCPQQALLWTDIGLWSMQYIGQPYIYSFNEVGSGCGLIGRKAAASINGVVFWMGPSQFFTLGANGVEPIACPVWDVIFQNLDTTRTHRIRAAVNSRFGEIAWFYPTTDSDGEVNAYVKYNVLLNAWDFGILGRSAWIDQSVLGPPIGADPNTLYLQQHETSPDADGQPMSPSFRTGYFAMADGDLKTFVDQVWPDMKFGYYGGMANATVNITFYTTDYPGDTPVAYGPYPVTQTTEFISPRFRARLVAIEISSSDIGSFWRIGNIRYRLAPDGKF